MADTLLKDAYFKFDDDLNICDVVATFVLEIMVIFVVTAFHSSGACFTVHVFVFLFSTKGAHGQIPVSNVKN